MASQADGRMKRGNLTLTQFLIEERRRHPGATGELNGLILAVALACKAIAIRLGQGTVAGVPPKAGEMPEPCIEEGSGKYALLFEPLDGSSNIDVNASVGSLFSIVRPPLLQPGSAQVAAGYAIYGPSTLLVLSVGNGTHAFTLERSIGEFMLTHRALSIPAASSELAIDSSNSRFWERPIRRYVAECLQGASGPRARDFDMHWIASLVAEAHRILMRGGVFLHPRDGREPPAAGGLRMLQDAHPIAFLVEQAGGRASTGRTPVLALAPRSRDERVDLVFGSRDEVERIERYYTEDVEDAGADLPLFQARGLFRDSMAT